MPEDIQDGQVEQVVEETKVQGEVTPEALSTSEKPTEEPQGEEAKLDPSVKERTKEQFDKLKANNADLKRQLEERKALPSVLDYLNGPVPKVKPEARQQYVQPVQQQPVYQQPAPSQPVAPQLTDEQGYVNADVLKKRLNVADEALKKAKEAEARALAAEQRTARFEQDAETKVLYKSYPELDPMSEVFNKDAYDLVKNEITSQVVSSGKRDSMEAASRMSKYFRKPEEKPVIEQRAQASVTGNAQRVVSKPIAEMTIAERLARF